MVKAQWLKCNLMDTGLKFEIGVRWRGLFLFVYIDGWSFTECVFTAES